jgi:hypothetical protein
MAFEVFGRQGGLTDLSLRNTKYLIDQQRDSGLCAVPCSLYSSQLRLQLHDCAVKATRTALLEASLNLAPSTAGLTCNVWHGRTYKSKSSYVT